MVIPIRDGEKRKQLILGTVTAPGTSVSDLLPGQNFVKYLQMGHLIKIAYVLIKLAWIKY